MKHYTVTFQPDQVSVSIHAGATILEAASQVDIVLNTTCGAQGTCGKCTVNIQPEDTAVLACQHTVDCDMIVRIPDTSRFYRQQILLHGIDRQIRLAPNITKIFLSDPPAIQKLLTIKVGDTLSHIHPL
ncbi:MAG: 2Fe-2S iron-sulfur cluster binding domain-containing protein, partial [Anaerohalosphaera sp.]|nr:2Fe-2S iron-sulfur cluster binding domain-containing protein [Anaerohalosphaera sp.]